MRKRQSIAERLPMAKTKVLIKELKKMKVTSVQVDTWGFEKGRHEGAQITHAGYCSSTHGGRHHKKNNIYLFYEEEKIIHAYIHTFFCISMTRHLFLAVRHVAYGRKCDWSASNATN